MNPNRIHRVYESLKDHYPLLLTTTTALDECFTIDCPVIVGQAHGQILELYEDDDLLVLDVMDAHQTMGTHWHPNDIAAAIRDIRSFMDGKFDYALSPFA